MPTSNLGPLAHLGGARHHFFQVVILHFLGINFIHIWKLTSGFIFYDFIGITLIF